MYLMSTTKIYTYTTCTKKKKKKNVNVHNDSAKYKIKSQKKKHTQQDALLSVCYMCIRNKFMLELPLHAATSGRT